MLHASDFDNMRHIISTILLSLIAVFAAADEALPVVSFVTPKIVRVQWHPDGGERDNATGVCVYEPQEVKSTTLSDNNTVKYLSDELEVVLDLSTKALTFIDRKTGNTLLSEDTAQPRNREMVVEETIIYDDATAHSEDTANGKVTVKDIIRRDTVGMTDKFTANFILDGAQALYGLGSHMEDYMNLMGKTLYLTQHNLKITVPVLVSTLGYGLLFDAGCAMKFDSAPLEGSNSYGMTMEMDAARELDYYFIKGDDMQDVAAGYRHLTGQVSLMPRYVFGYIQSKERYVSSDDIINTLREFRNRHIPIDMIVQDWNYWPQGWGYMKMNEKYYPDPAALADSVHSMNARLMVSIWPNPQYCPQADDFREKGYMLENSVYDAFDPEARKYYWKYANDEFFSKGFDAWWCDSSEPLDGDWNQIPEQIGDKPYSREDHERRWHLNKDILSSTLGAERSSLYGLYHAKGIYENQRATDTDKRVVNLTRSGYAGQQRYSTILWNGDVSASWESLRQQIPSGLNYMATGNPYWTVDVGCFFTGNDNHWFRKGEFPQGVKDKGYRDFYTRMFQWATFLPVLRSHGTDTPREPWQFGEPGTEHYDAILKMINLRYSLMPYIYSKAAEQTRGGYSMARPLAFDFPKDHNVYDIKDQYMFGDFLVCPVTSPDVDTRKVYLPSSPDGTGWTDFWTGERHQGGKWIEALTPIDRLPLFVKDGSIITDTAPTEYSAAQKGQPVTINVYPGKDSEFTLYDDNGDGYGYERGESSLIKMKWNDKNRTLEIDNEQGSYPEAPDVRVFTVKTPYGEKTVNYTGKKMKVSI